MVFQVNGDRSYKIEYRNQLEELTLSQRAVTGLTKLNTNKRTHIAVDKYFIKALLIAVCGIAHIRQSVLNAPFHDGQKEFMKSTFG